MVVDTDDYVGTPNAPEQDQVAIINPDNLDNEAEQLLDLPKATERTLPLTC
jgi:ubiquitin carboxyl-terminal hydrolase 7